MRSPEVSQGRRVHIRPRHTASRVRRRWQSLIPIGLACWLAACGTSLETRQPTASSATAASPVHVAVTPPPATSMPASPSQPTLAATIGKPSAGTWGWYTDWWNDGAGGPPKWETFHLVELAQLLERNWQAGDKRAVAGYSMGGMGAMAYAARHPGMFLAAAAYSGVLDTLGAGAYTQSTATWGDPTAQADVWRAHNPLDLAAALKGVALYVSYGDG